MHIFFLKPAIPGLRIHSKSKHKALRRSSTGALWEIEGIHAGYDDTVRAQNESQTTQPPTQCSRPGHVMLSYQWDSQDLVLRIKKKLQKAGFNVWMDLDKLSKLFHLSWVML